MSLSKLNLFNSYFEMSLYAAKFTAELILNSSSTFSISFPGGSSPLLYFKILADLPSLYNHWNRVLIFQGDERFVKPPSPYLNSKLIEDNFLNFVPYLKPKFFKINTSISHIKKSAIDYTSLMSTLLQNDSNGFPNFDLVVLGIGNDGHTASIFPESEALYSASLSYIPVHPPTTSQPYLPRITMTMPLINSAKNKIFLLSGPKKNSLLKSMDNSSPFNHVKYPKFFASIHDK